MQTLNMDLDDAYKALMGMTTAHSNMSDALKQMRDQINLVLRDQQDWQGVSARDFYENYMAGDEKFSAQLEEFNTLGTTLRAEVDQWTKAAAS